MSGDPVDGMVSVVVPARNAAKWIRDTLLSVVDQTWPKDRLEICLVDDASTDGTQEIAHQILLGRGVPFKVFRFDTARGPSAARNRGWRDSCGEWIQFLDSDDILDSGKISHQMGAAATVDPRVCALHSAWGRLTLTQDGWVAMGEPVDPAFDQDAVRDLLDDTKFMATGSQLFRRAWLERVDGFNESYRLVEDVDLLLRLAIAGGWFQRVPSAGPLFWYRQRAESLSTQDERAFVEARARNALFVEQHWRQRDEITPERAARLASVHLGVARFFAAHDLEAFENTVAVIERLRPRFVPDRPLRLRWLSRLVGYRRAELVSVRYRQMRGILGRRGPLGSSPA